MDFPPSRKKKITFIPLHNKLECKLIFQKTKTRKFQLEAFGFIVKCNSTILFFSFSITQHTLCIVFSGLVFPFCTYNNINYFCVLSVKNSNKFKINSSIVYNRWLLVIFLTMANYHIQIMKWVHT